MAIAQSAGPILLPLFIWGNLSDAPVDAESLAVALFFCFGVGCFAGVWGKLRLRLRPIEASDEDMPAQELTEFRRFALFNLLAVISSVVALFIVRAWIIEGEGLEFAGLFEAGWTLSFNYTTLFLTGCNTFYLPMLARANGIERQRACILKVAYGVLGVSVLVCYAMMVWQGALIHLFYSPRFEASREVFSILIVAVMLRGVSWVYGTLLVATRRATVLLISDLTMNLGLLITVRYALNTQASLESLGWAFVVPHFMYLIFIVEYVRSTNSKMLRRHIWPVLLVAVSPLIFFALNPDFLHWSSTGYARAIIGAFCFVLCGVIYRVFRKMAV
jgi:O-antigen/teichoic acid export membrane protein